MSSGPRVFDVVWVTEITPNCEEAGIPVPAIDRARTTAEHADVAHEFVVYQVVVTAESPE